MDGEISQRGLVLVGCGRMGTALLKGWLDRGLPPASAYVQDPAPASWLAEAGVALNAPLPADPAVLVLAVKPQLMAATLGPLAGRIGPGTLVISIAAGLPLAVFEAAFGAHQPVVRAMPNTPAAIGRGVSALVANAAAGEAGLARAEGLMAAVGATVRLEAEAQMDAVTALSGSGPAYVFHLIEALVAAGQAEGLPADLALRLARATVLGAGALAEATEEAPAALREAVTSPGGTTAAGLGVLMAEPGGLTPLIEATVAAAAARSRELGQ